MQVKLKVLLTEQVHAVLNMRLDIPKDQENLAEALGIGKQERENLIGQAMQNILMLMGNSDEV